LDKHGRALESDLIALGLRLRWCPCEWFNWHDLIIIIEHSSVDSQLYKSMHPDDAGWTLTNLLLATIADVLRWLQWAKTKDGAKNRNQPDPIPRPGVARNRQVHPKVKGAPRSKIRKLLGRTGETPNKAQRLAALFSGKSEGGGD
jgi:hypothetical protein